MHTEVRTTTRVADRATREAAVWLATRLRWEGRLESLRRPATDEVREAA